MKADRDAVAHQLAIAKGQMEGISKMVEEDAYCISISTQLLATIALLKRLNVKILTAHLEGCVKSAKSEQELDEKIKEVESILKRMSE